MLLNRMSIEDLGDQLNGKRILMRVDFNVPFDKEGNVSDLTRIKATIPSISYILNYNIKNLILISHCGRPDGQKVPKYSLSPVSKILSELLQKNVIFCDDCIGQNVQNVCNNNQNKDIILLENLRFHIEEEGKGKDKDGNEVKASSEDKLKFGEELSKLGDIFVNDAFGTAHRAHTSMVGLKFDIKVCGFLMQKELNMFSQILEKPKKPLLAILGGAKVKDKIQLIYHMLDKVDEMILGGGLAFTFKKVLNNMKIGNSLFDEEGSKIVEKIMEKAKENNVYIHLPTDFVCATEFSNDAKNIQVFDENEGIPDNWIGLDCGPKSLQIAKQVILRANTIVWNGAQGVFEFPNFANGSLQFLEYIVESTKKGSISVAGGGETVALIEQAVHTADISHVSTGGGASLELLEGKILPGVVYLSLKQ